MLVSNSDGCCLEGLLAAILLRAACDMMAIDLNDANHFCLEFVDVEGNWREQLKFLQVRSVQTFRFRAEGLAHFCQEFN